MQSLSENATSAAEERLRLCYSGQNCDWDRFYKPKQQMLNFATRYHLVYPALAYFVTIKHDPDRQESIRPLLDTIYRGLLEPRCWSYWHTELNETTWPLQERNLTYAGRLATFTGLYIDAFDEPPAERIELDGRTTTYRELSHSLWEQMTSSPSCGVSCYNHQSMLMCNAHLLINNVLHDRLFGTSFESANAPWLKTVQDHLIRSNESGPIFFFGTKSDSPEPVEEMCSVGADFWALFLMSSIVPEQVVEWFRRAQRNIVHEGESAHVQVADWEVQQEFSSDELASAWAFCLAKELGELELAACLQRYLQPRVLEGFELDPYVSGLCLLGNRLEPGAFHRLIDNGIADR